MSDHHDRAQELLDLLYEKIRKIEAENEYLRELVDNLEARLSEPPRPVFRQAANPWRN